MTLTTPAKALAPYMVEAGPYTTSMRSMLLSAIWRVIQAVLEARSLSSTPSTISSVRLVSSER